MLDFVQTLITLTLALLLIVTVILFASICYGGDRNCTNRGGNDEAKAAKQPDASMSLADGMVPDGASVDAAAPDSLAPDGDAPDGMSP